MSVDQRLRAAYSVHDVPVDTAGALTRVHDRHRRLRRTRVLVAGAAAATAVVLVAVGVGLAQGHERADAPVVPPPSITPSNDPIADFAHHQGVWQTRELTAADFTRELDRRRQSAWAPALLALLPDGPMRLVQDVEGLDWTLSVVAGGRTTVLDRRTVVGTRFVVTRRADGAHGSSTFNHASSDGGVGDLEARVTTYSHVTTTEPDVHGIPSTVYLNALYRVARFRLVAP